MRDALRELGERPERRLVRQPPAVLRRAVPGVVSARRPGARAVRPGDRRRARISCRSIRRRTCRRLSRRSARRAGRVRRRSRRDGHLGDLVALAADRLRLAGRSRNCSRITFPMDLRPQAHDIIRTWLFDSVLRAHLEHDSLPWTQRGDFGLGARSRSQEDVEVEGQRRHADGAARGARLGRRALLGGERPARHRHGVRSRTR